MLDGSLSRRLTVLAVAWLLVGGLLGALLLSLVFATAVQNRFDVKLNAVARSVAAAVAPDEHGGPTVRPIGEPRFSQLGSGWYWQIGPGGDGPPRSTSLGAMVLRVAPEVIASAPVPQDMTGPFGHALRVAGTLVEVEGIDGSLPVFVAIETSEIDQEIASFSTLLFASLALFVAALAIAIVAQIRVGLAPLRWLNADLSTLLSGRTERIDKAYPREIQPLVDTINEVLEADRRIVEQSRRAAGNLAHAIKTELAVLKTAARTPELTSEVDRQIDKIAGIVEHHAGRAAASGLARTTGPPVSLADVVESICAALRRVYADRDLMIVSDLSGEPHFTGDRQDLEEMVGNLIENACKHAQTRVAVRSEDGDTMIQLTVDDDGPGLSASEMASIGNPGVRMDETAPGFGLGLSIVRDLAEGYGGQLTFAPSDFGGLQARLTLPLR